MASRPLFIDGTPRKPRTEPAELDITPMIDVTFLLLIFFMVTSTMQKDPVPDLPEAKYGEGADQANSVVISIMSREGEPKIICADGDGPAAALEDVEEYTKTEIENGKSGVIIKASRDVPFKFVRDVAGAVHGNADVQFFIGVDEKPVAQ